MNLKNAVARSNREGCRGQHLHGRIDVQIVLLARHLEIFQSLEKFAGVVLDVDGIFNGGIARVRRPGSSGAVSTEPAYFRMLPIAQIGLRLGFDDPAYFSRIFRQRIGMPPSEYRSIHHSGVRNS
jgi:AraC family transcriptional activator of pobA